ncbi:hypothetical protein Tco_0327845 [Tanacetum coccineum]
MMLESAEECISSTRRDLARVSWDHYYLRSWVYGVYGDVFLYGVIREGRPNEALVTLSSLVSFIVSFVIIMPPKRMSQAMIEKLIGDKVAEAIAANRATRGDAGGAGGPAGRAGGPARAPAVRECTFAGFMKCNPVTFHGKEGAVELCRWFKKTKMVFSISECTKGKKVKFLCSGLLATTTFGKDVLEIGDPCRWTLLSHRGIGVIPRCISTQPKPWPSLAFTPYIIPYSSESQDLSWKSNKHLENGQTNHHPEGGAAQEHPNGEYWLNENLFLAIPTLSWLIIHSLQTELDVGCLSNRGRAPGIDHMELYFTI